MSSKISLASGTALFALAATAAQAHPGLGPQTGFVRGLIHPFTGWDHWVAMLAIAFWAAQRGSRLLLPAAFLGAMALGAVAGHHFGPIPGIEQGIALSVLVTGLLIARSVSLPAPAGVALVGVFAVFHGAAHGAEMPASAGSLAFGGGFLAATAFLLFAGAALAAWCPPRGSQVAGWTVAAAGLALAIGIGR